jgi:hypothetical protein
MERFFAPTRRLQHEEIYGGVDDEDDGDDENDEDDRDDERLPFEFTEVQLAVPVEAFLNQSWGWPDFLTFMTASVLPTIVWVSKDAFLSIGNVSPVLASDQLENWQNLHFHFTTTNGEFRVLFLTKPALPATLSDGESSIFWHTVMTSNCRKLVVASNSIGSGLCTAPVLTDFLGGSSLLRELVLMGFVFEKDHCHALATLERTDLDISFAACNFKTQDVNDLFIEWLRHSQVVTALTYCEMESCILSALRGNSSVKRLIYRTKCDEQGEDHLRSLVQALSGNQGLEELDVSNLTESRMVMKRGISCFTPCGRTLESCL